LSNASVVANARERTRVALNKGILRSA
jgi:hypothetical protein